MNNSVQIFKNNKFGEVRIVTTENNDPLFCLADVCKILELQTGATKNRLNERGISLINTPTSSGNQNMIFVDEPNFYTAVFQSRKPEAEAFTDWVTSEVLPSIRKHGAYMTSSVIEKALSDPDTIIQLANTIKEERRQKEILQKKNLLQQIKLERQAPVVEFANKVLTSTSGHTATVIASELNMSAVTLNRMLMKARFLRRVGTKGEYALYANYQGQGYVIEKTNCYERNDKTTGTKITLEFTEKGRMLIHEIFESAISSGAVVEVKGRYFYNYEREIIKRKR